MTTVRNPPPDTAFVFSNKIILQGNLSKDEKNKFNTNLPSYWDDSAFARKQQEFGIKYVLDYPPIFDSLNVLRSVKFMDAYLKSQGYFYSTFKDSLDTTKETKKVRVTINGRKKKVEELLHKVSITMTVSPGKPTIIDSFSYNIPVARLQKIANNTFSGTLIKPGKTVFAKDIIAAELDRFVNICRNRGFFLLTRDNLVAEADTIAPALIDFSTDPFLQAEKIEQAIQQKKTNPTCTVVVKLRQSADTTVAYDSSKLRVFKMGNIFYYPETAFTQIPDSIITDTSAYQKYVLVNKNKSLITIFYKKQLFIPQPIKEHTYMYQNTAYSEFTYYRTINNLAQIPAWQQVDTRYRLRNDTVDFHIFLVPAVKQNFTVDLQASRNTGDFLSSNNLFGLFLNTTYRNRNLWQRAVQSVTTFSNGIELSFEPDLPLLQTVQSSLGQTYTFPRFIAPFKIDKTRKLDNVQTQFGINGSYTDRSEFFRLRSLVGDIAYQWKKRNKLWKFTPINIELYSLDTLSQLETAFKTNPFLRTAFNTGSVVSSQLGYSVSYPGKHLNITNYLNLGGEVTLWGTAIAALGGLESSIYQFAKVQGQFIHTINYKNSQFAFRAVAGIGYNYGNDSKFGVTLPFFKQFFEGGPNSMRGWGLRQLGLGSSLLSDTASSSFRDRYGDMELETNLEYRFPIATIGGVRINSALFTDIGNIWNIRNDPNNPDGTFKLNNLGKDIAIAVGTGLRLDFNYFLIRVDFGLKLKDPTRYENDGWLSIKDFTWRNTEYIVKDANTGTIINRDNYALQLGIGLPF